MKNIVELKTKDGKVRTCKINGRSKKLYVDMSNPKVHYIRHNNKYIPKDQYNKKRKMRGGGVDVYMVVIVEHTDESQKKSYKIGNAKYGKLKGYINGINSKNKDTSKLISGIKTSIKFEYKDVEIHICTLNTTDTTLTLLQDIYPSVDGRFTTNPYSNNAKNITLNDVNDSWSGLQNDSVNLYTNYLKKSMDITNFILGGNNSGVTVDDFKNYIQPNP